MRIINQFSPQSEKIILSLDHVNVSLNGSPVLHDINWTLQKGENWVITGHNGSGKSTFLRLIRGEIWPAPVNGGTRTYYFDDEPTHSPIGIRRKIALVSAEQQTRYTRQEWLLHGWQIVFTGLFDGDLLYRYPTEAERELVRQSMMRVGISDLFEANYQKLSQGQLRKLLIARALISRPPVLALDEICVGLDAESRRQVLDLVEEVAADGTQILYVNHRREEILQAITHELVIKEGRAESREYRAEHKVLRVERKALRTTQHLALSTQDSQLLAIQNANVAVDEGKVMVLHDINWQMHAGENWLVYGHNGAGKTTLLKLILGEWWPAAGGSITRFGEDFNNVWEIKNRIGFFSSELQTRYNVDLPARDVIMTGFYSSIGWLQNTTPAQRERADELIEQFNLQALAKRNLLQMSYGQARKVLIARALVNRPRLMLLDEPFDGLDVDFKAELSEIFNAATQHNNHTHSQTNLILVSHYETDTLACITHGLQLERGRIVAQIKYGEVAQAFT